MSSDKELIKKLGGVLAVARFFGYNYNTVYNWTYRGIPPKIKIAHPDYFLNDNPPKLTAKIADQP